MRDETARYETGCVGTVVAVALAQVVGYGKCRLALVIWKLAKVALLGLF